MKKIIFSLILSLLLPTMAVAASAHRQKYTAPPPKKMMASCKYCCSWRCQKNMHSLIKTLKNYQVKTIVYPYKLRLIIPGYVLFNPMSDQLTDTSKPLIKVLAKLLRQFPYAKIGIYAYSDDIASSKNNKAATLARAQKIAGKFWIKGIPLKTQTLNYYGRGEKSSISDNDTVKRMADNRRVAIWVYLPH